MRANRFLASSYYKFEISLIYLRICSGRFGEGEERSNAVKPQAAKCSPELQTVSLKLDNDSSTIVYPACTRIQRCGGCCSSSLLSCQPTAMETRNFEVIDQSRDLGSSQLCTMFITAYQYYQYHPGYFYIRNRKKESSNKEQYGEALCITDMHSPISRNLTNVNTLLLSYAYYTQEETCAKFSTSPFRVVCCFKVIVSTVSLRYRGRQIVPLEEHTACKCDCRIKEEVI